MRRERNISCQEPTFYRSISCHVSSFEVKLDCTQKVYFAQENNFTNVLQFQALTGAYEQSHALYFDWICHFKRKIRKENRGEKQIVLKPATGRSLYTRRIDFS